MTPFRSQEDFELIEDYLGGLLKPGKQEEVRLRILSDASFAALVDEITELQLGVERAALAADLDSFHSDIANQPTPVPIRKLKLFHFWGIAASFFLAITAGLWLLIGQKSPDERLYLTYYEQDPGLVSSMSSAGNYDFDRAMVDYKSGKYQQAQAAFGSLLKNDTENDTLLYFSAMAELSLENNQAAEELLQAVSRDSTSGFSKDSFWYLGLLALREGDYASAKKYLDQSGRAKAEELTEAITELSAK